MRTREAGRMVRAIRCAMAAGCPVELRYVGGFEGEERTIWRCGVGRVVRCVIPPTREGWFCWVREDGQAAEAFPFEDVMLWDNGVLVVGET